MIPETYFSIGEQLRLFLISCLSGLVIGAAYDIFRMFRVIFPHNNILVAIEDIIFILLYAIFVIAFNSVAARGEFRFYYVIGNIIGFVIYFFTIGSVVIKVIKKLLKIIYYVIDFIMRPFRFIYVTIFKKNLMKFVGYCQKHIKSNKNSKRLLIDDKKMLYNKNVNQYKKRKNVNQIAQKAKKKKQKKVAV